MVFLIARRRRWTYSSVCRNWTSNAVKRLSVSRESRKAWKEFSKDPVPVEPRLHVTYQKLLRNEEHSSNTNGRGDNVGRECNTIDIYWQEDRENAFALTILGTGLNVGVTTVSPSGQWSLWSGYMGRYDANWGSPVIRGVTAA